MGRTRLNAGLFIFRNNVRQFVACLGTVAAFVHKGPNERGCRW